ncbi:general transcription factor II-I repeat domain-containing protein 2-like [Portunus trituberculatus]|uniref:general transcription factor II-I repeat domain-containing protein 2-like n=1 Tax=Portunus trituberculatus TaxID=210409 RepID=UPI001E1CBB06|nr:general transcription factor II-I repeat domain-containing protein 2-like [Portunus trituberculatus]
MSASTATRKSEILADDVLAQLDAAIQSAPCISLAIDESTDVTDNAQLLVYVRFCNKDKKEICEDLLGVTPLETHTRGEDIYAAIKEMLRKRGIDLKQVVSVTTDGAPAMIGKERGAVSRMKEDNPDLLAYHCLIHQTVLCATLSQHFAEVMNTVMKLINFLRASSSLQHRLLREFLADVEANANDLLLHNNVRWLSKGNALGRFWSVREEIAAFLEQVKSQRATQFSLFLQDEHKMNMVAFLVDITSHLNELNVKLQGQNNTVADLMTAIRSFQRKLDIFKEDLEGGCEHFPKLQEQIQGERDVYPYVDFIDKLIGNFSKRFNSSSLGQQLLLLIQNPFLIREVRGFSKEVTQTFKWAHAGSLQLELIDLQGNAPLREHFEATDPATFWLQTVSESVFPGLTKVALHTLTMFGSTYSLSDSSTPTPHPWFRANFCEGYFVRMDYDGPLGSPRAGYKRDLFDLSKIPLPEKYPMCRQLQPGKEHHLQQLLQYIPPINAKYLKYALEKQAELKEAKEGLRQGNDPKNDENLDYNDEESAVDDPQSMQQ